MRLDKSTPSLSWIPFFAKHDSVIALSKLYDLKDPRLAGVQVKGDLIPNTDGRIMTRSRARISKHQPIRFSSPSIERPSTTSNTRPALRVNDRLLYFPFWPRSLKLRRRIPT
jgi:hypothetical protein